MICQYLKWSPVFGLLHGFSACTLLSFGAHRTWQWLMVRACTICCNEDGLNDMIISPHFRYTLINRKNRKVLVPSSGPALHVHSGLVGYVWGYIMWRGGRSNMIFSSHMWFSMKTFFTSQRLNIGGSRHIFLYECPSVCVSCLFRFLMPRKRFCLLIFWCFMGWHSPLLQYTPAVKYYSSWSLAHNAKQWIWQLIFVMTGVTARKILWDQMSL